MSGPVNSVAFVAIKMGRRTGARSGAYLNRYVTDPAAAGQLSVHFHRNPTGRCESRGIYGTGHEEKEEGENALGLDGEKDFSPEEAIGASNQSFLS